MFIIAHYPYTANGWQSVFDFAWAKAPSFPKAYVPDAITRKSACVPLISVSREYATPQWLLEKRQLPHLLYRLGYKHDSQKRVGS